MNKKFLDERRGRTLEYLGALTLVELEKIYLEVSPDSSRDDFKDQIVTPMMGRDSMGGDELYIEVKKTRGLDPGCLFKLGPLLISCAYCMQGMRALDDNERELAWSYMADARYWCAMTLSLKGIEVARAETIRETRKNTARKGGLMHADRLYKNTKEEAFRLARERATLGKGWPSRRNAANSIKNSVLDFAKKNNQPLSEQQAANTIYNWLKGMPDADTIFPKKKKSDL